MLLFVHPANGIGHEAFKAVGSVRQRTDHRKYATAESGCHHRWCSLHQTGCATGCYYFVLKRSQRSNLCPIAGGAIAKNWSIVIDKLGTAGWIFEDLCAKVIDFYIDARFAA